ncbi:hypothetical protein [Paenibacillus beijingensis]|uniref:Uncharacterized protein n=1 Tax=Paenibacillus beijingensis TaxID=1126833 RepID=A0A0D5NNY6_9BACL|nr:hypothetical protein [Paenibacillus beijingensis]AJY77039.1 hypothetical protein VN24_23915 [Paenibacillus beijingensis]
MTSGIRITIGIVFHLILGLLFPYILVGSILLLYGFMTPPTVKEQWTGTLIAFIYAAVLIVLNVWLLRRLHIRERMKRLLLHAAVWAASAAAMLLWLRFGSG